jgi:hypothetical protein
MIAGDVMGVSGIDIHDPLKSTIVSGRAETFQQRLAHLHGSTKSTNIMQAGNLINQFSQIENNLARKDNTSANITIIE